MTDLPARSGRGSSSAFTVGLLNGFYALSGKMFGKRHFALKSIQVEQDNLKETVGSQDPGLDRLWRSKSRRFLY